MNCIPLNWCPVVPSFPNSNESLNDHNNRTTWKYTTNRIAAIPFLFHPDVDVAAVVAQRKFKANAQKFKVMHKEAQIVYLRALEKQFFNMWRIINGVTFLSHTNALYITFDQNISPLTSAAPWCCSCPSLLFLLLLFLLFSAPCSCFFFSNSAAQLSFIYSRNGLGGEGGHSHFYPRFLLIMADEHNPLSPFQMAILSPFSTASIQYFRSTLLIKYIHTGKLYLTY